MKMNRSEFTDRLNYAQREVKFLKSVKMNCTSCEKFSDGKCATFGEVPPDFVQRGCDEWSFDEVPF